MELDAIIDLSRYPINAPGSEALAELVEVTRTSYLRDGIVICPGFLTEEAVTRSVEEVMLSRGKEWLTNSTHNVFLDQGDPAFPVDHVRNRQLPTSVASLAFDLLHKDGPLLSLYNNDHFTSFLAQVLGLESFYRLEDPLGAASINIFPPGTAHNWHFDEVKLVLDQTYIHVIVNNLSVSIFRDNNDPKAGHRRIIQKHKTDSC